MTLIKWNDDFMPAVSNVFDDFFNGDWPRVRVRVPSDVAKVNVMESNDKFVLEVAAPGMSKEDFTVNVDNDRLTIKGQKESKEESEDIRCTRREFSFSSFERTFTLPNTVQGDSIKANYKDGILFIEIPKKEEAVVKPSREIEIA
jgi:HSP20 family protein